MWRIETWGVRLWSWPPKRAATRHSQGEGAVEGSNQVADKYHNMAYTWPYHVQS